MTHYILGLPPGLVTPPLVYLFAFGLLFLILGGILWAMATRRKQWMFRGLAMVGVVMAVVSIFLAYVPISNLFGP